MPEIIEKGKIYFSLRSNTVLHQCPCGCGNIVNTPLSPVGWQMTYDGSSVSIYPSVSNSAFECRSHYWIENGEIRWCRKWNDKEIYEARKSETEKARVYFKDNSNDNDFINSNIYCESIKEGTISIKEKWIRKLMFWRKKSEV